MRLDRRGFMQGSLGSLATSALAAQLLPEPGAAATPGDPGILVSRPVPDAPQLPQLRARYAFSVSVFFRERIVIDSPRGRAYVPAIGGEIWGPRLQGRVLPYSGADYGSGGLVAHYIFQASDGALIYIVNYATIQRLGEDGLPVPPRPATATVARAPGVAPQQEQNPNASVGVKQRFRTAPVFDAPAGPHAWLNRTVFVGHGERRSNPDHSIFTYYELL